MIQVDISNIWGQLSLRDLLAMENEVAAAHAALTEGTGEGSEFRDWLTLTVRETTKELERACTATCDSLKLRIELHFVQSGRTNHNCVCICNVVAYIIYASVKYICTNRCDFIH